MELSGTYVSKRYQEHINSKRSYREHMLGKSLKTLKLNFFLDVLNSKTSKFQCFFSCLHRVLSKLGEHIRKIGAHLRGAVGTGTIYQGGLERVWYALLPGTLDSNAPTFIGIFEGLFFTVFQSRICVFFTLNQNCLDPRSKFI